MAEDIQGPLVFSCLNCRTIVGDSFSLICTNADLKSVTISQASSIARLEDLITSKEGIDRGSTYFSITCRPCNSYLGRFYITTPKALDDLRECFTFLVDNISSYELGKGEFGMRLNNNNNSSSMDDDKNNKEEEENEILKVKHVLLDMTQRLMRLEEKKQQRSSHEQGGNEDEEEDTDILPTQPQFNNNENDPDNAHYNPHNLTYQHNHSHNNNMTKSGEKQHYSFNHPTPHYDDTNANATVTPTHKRLRV